MCVNRRCAYFNNPRNVGFVLCGLLYLNLWRILGILPSADVIARRYQLHGPGSKPNFPHPSRPPSETTQFTVQLVLRVNRPGCLLTLETRWVRGYRKSSAISLLPSGSSMSFVGYIFPSPLPLTVVTCTSFLLNMNILWHNLFFRCVIIKTANGASEPYTAVKIIQRCRTACFVANLKDTERECHWFSETCIWVLG